MHANKFWSETILFAPTLAMLGNPYIGFPLYGHRQGGERMAGFLAAARFWWKMLRGFPPYVWRTQLWPPTSASGHWLDGYYLARPARNPRQWHVESRGEISI